jgi:hypothetical protein
MRMRMKRINDPMLRKPSRLLKGVSTFAGFSKDLTTESTENTEVLFIFSL